MLNDYENLTPEEVQGCLNVGKNTVYALLADGELKGFRIGKMWKIPVKALNEFVDAKVGK